MSDLTRVDDLFGEWLAAQQRGTPLTPEAMCADTPELLTGLKACIFAYNVGQTPALGDPHATHALTEHPSTQTVPNASGGTRFPVLPGYRIEKELGRGGMGVVYRAHDERLKRTVAIKMVLHGVVVGVQALARFRMEAEAMAALEHPHIVRVFAQGEYEELPYIVMEYCAGGALATTLQDHPLTPTAAATLVEQLAQGMDAAHQRGILHRDVKPGNVLWGSDGTPKLTDFGLAKRFTDTDAAGLTQSGAVMGTPSYMAPEQARGDSKRTGPATDVYGLGALLYHALTGRPPFLGANTIDTLRQVTDNEPLDPNMLVPEVPRDLVTICLKCLCKEPTQRYSTAQALADDLARYRTGQPIHARRVGVIEHGWKWVRRHPGVSLAVCLIAGTLCAGTTASYLGYREAKAQEAQAKVNEQVATDNASAEAARVRERDAALADVQAREADLRYALGNTHMVLANTAFYNNDVRLAREYLDQVPVTQRRFEWHHRARQVEGGLFTLYGHKNPHGVAFSPDGLCLVTVDSFAGTLHWWDARTGQQRRMVQHTAGLLSVAYSPDGRFLATCSYDKTAQVWDAQTGVRLAVCRGHQAAVYRVAFSPDSTRVVTASLDHTAMLWTRRGERTHTLQGHTAGVEDACFAPDGQHVLTGATDNTARLWDASSGQVVRTFTAHQSTVRRVAFSPDGLALATASDDRRVIVWDRYRGERLITLAAFNSTPTCLAFHPDGTTLATGDADGVLRVWERQQGKELYALRGHTEMLSDVAFRPDGTHLVSAGYDGTVKLWRATATQQATRVFRNQRGFTYAAFSHDATQWVAGGLSNVRTGATISDRVRDLLGHQTYVSAIKFHPDGRHAVTSDWDGKVLLWEVPTGTLVRTFVTGSRTPVTLAFSPDGSELVTATPSALLFWDTATGAKLRTCNAPMTIGNSVAFSPNGRHLVTGSADGPAQLWDVATGTVRQAIDAYPNQTTNATFSPDSKLVAVGRNASVSLCEVATGSVRFALQGHTKEVTCLAFSADGTRLATGSDDTTVIIWDTRTGQALGKHTEITTKVLAVAFTPNGDRLAAFTNDGTSVVWDGLPLPPRTTIDERGPDVLAVTFNPQGTQLAVARRDRTVTLWDVATRQRTRVLTGLREAAFDLAYSTDGSRLVGKSVTQEVVVWDTATGDVVRDAQPPLLRSYASATGAWAVHVGPQSVALMPATLTATEFAARLQATEADERPHRDAYLAAVQAKDNTAAYFHLHRYMAMPPKRILGNYRALQRVTNDPRLLARTSFWHPMLATTPYDRELLHVMACNGDALAKRLRAQELLRAKQPARAIPLLYECLLLRAVAMPPRPPVEELLLALAYRQLNQPVEADRCYHTAVNWLDRPRLAVRVANLVTLTGVNGWAALGETGRTLDDPRGHAAQWEAWHECDLFRSQYERGRKP